MYLCCIKTVGSVSMLQKTRILVWLEQVPTLFRYLFSGAIILFIAWLHPKRLPFSYEFERGQIWRHEAIIAPFDFAIEKSESELNKEIKEIQESQLDYYTENGNAVAQISKTFGQHLLAEGNSPDVSQENCLAPAVVDGYTAILTKIITPYYEKGVVRLRPNSNPSRINVLEENTQREYMVRNLYLYDFVQKQITDTLAKIPLNDVKVVEAALYASLQPNITFSDSLTQVFKQIRLSQITPYKDIVRKDEIIVAEGGTINSETYQKLISLRHNLEKGNSSINETREDIWQGGYFLGYLIITAILIFFYGWYLYIQYPAVFFSFRQQVFLLLLLTLYAYIVFLANSTSIINLYAIPFCILPIIVKSFYDKQLALVTHIICILIVSYVSSLSNVFSFAFIQLVAGITAILSDTSTRYRTRFFFALEYIFLTYIFAYLGLTLMREGTWQSFDWQILKWLSINIFLTLLSYPLIPVLGNLFGYVSEATLLDLADLDNPLLRELSVKAPGTMQHSLQVANLAEEAALAINANALLVRTAALYHDIGKMLKPLYFTENQSGESPHQALTPPQSAEIIIQHVTKGAKMARRHRLPQSIIDFILTHHGTTRVEFFYRTHLQTYPDAVDTRFRYPGPKPQSREEAILMLADSIEATCKSLKTPTADNISATVDKTIAQKIEQQQLVESHLSFKELEIIRQVFKTLLNSIYHVRIEYPEENK